MPPSIGRIRDSVKAKMQIAVKRNNRRYGSRLFLAIDRILDQAGVGKEKTTSPSKILTA